VSSIDVSIVIVNWNTRRLLLDCLASVYETIKDLRFEVFVVDNGSSDGSVAAVRRAYPDVKLIENAENRGFAAANNQALRRMAGRYALLLNSDAVLTDGAVTRLVQFMDAHPSAGIACGQLLNEDGSKQNSIANFPSLLSLVANEGLLRLLWPLRFPSKVRDYQEPIVVESCIGACMIVRAAALRTVGLLDERYFFFFEETDWARMMREGGYTSHFVPDARIYHLQGKSAGAAVGARLLFHHSRLLYFKKWYPRRWPLFITVAGCRVLVNTLLNFVALLCTLGLVRSVRSRFLVNLRLLGWYLRGCPDPRMIQP